MGMTITEKILKDHTGLTEIHAGMLINAKIDVALANDITAPIAIREFLNAGGKEVFHKDRVIFVLDHFTPNKDIASAEQCKYIREFARKQNLTHYYEGGHCGVEHALLPEEGLVLPGDLVVGADSHTCTYGALGAFATGVGSTDLAAAMLTGELWFKVPATIKFILYGKRQKWVGGKDFILHIIGQIGVDGALYQAMEFTGEAVRDLPMADRFTMANMAIEAGGKNGIFAPDEKTQNYVKGRAKRPYRFYESDADATYVSVMEIDVSRLEPQVALPHLPSNVKRVGELDSITIDQAYIGSCTNGRIEDLRQAAEVLKGRKAHPYVRLIIVPATPRVYRAALKEGLIEIFLEAGAIVSPPTCGACLGGHMGILARGERAIATTNRNFIGRMGHPESEVYLANPAVAAASAVAGKIVSPEGL
ncbi:MAG TPA: 3-isopropylmalate dehydratase large subunit [Syntrophales bacterium]|nr:3-isopropylmalate dehydratase large subunit [Syntrophales bacterium]HOL59373.1 3-isopropylmalate dehydratase large subunit [Syntrophales bacterium]HPO35530.1 3-isopropylmalate dehydratase large subunit [Syntrophales bacterium]